MAAIVGALRAVLSLDSAAFSKGVKAAVADMKGLRLNMKTIGAGLKVGGAAMLAASSGMAMAIRGQLDAADEMGETAQKLGVPVEQLTALRHAAEMSGVTFDALGTGLRKLSQRMDDAAKGNKASAELFNGLGVSVTNADGSLRSAEAVLTDLSEVISKMPDGAEKTALAMDIFGKSGADLVPMLNQGKTAIDAFTDEARAMGIVISQDTADSAGRFNDHLDIIRKTIGGLVVQLAAALAPALESISGKVAEVARWFHDLSPATQELVAKLAVIGMAAGPVVLGLGFVVTSLGAVANALKAVALLAVANPVGLMIAGVAVAAGLVYTYWEEIKVFFAATWEAIKAGAAAAWAWVKDTAAAAFEGLKQVFLTYHPAGILYTHWDSVKAYFSALWDGIKGAASGAWQGVTQMSADAVAGTLRAWDGIKAVFAAVLSNVASAFVEGWQAIKAEVSTWPARFVEFGGQIVEGLKQGIMAKWEDMMAGLRAKWTELKDGFAGAMGIRSPSRVFRGYGENISEGLALGIGDKAPMVGQAMDGVSDALAGSGDSLKQNLESFKASIESAFVGFVTGAMSAKDALRQLAQQLAQMLAKLAFNQLFGKLFSGGGLMGSLFGFADGGVFKGGKVQAFAKGGVIAGATAFAMQGGLGVMGEAGPEAIMPLKRGPDGRLGVQAAQSDGAGVVQVMVGVDQSGNLRPFVQSVAGQVAVAVVEDYDRSALSDRVAQVRQDPRVKG